MRAEATVCIVRVHVDVNDCEFRKYFFSIRSIQIFLILYSEDICEGRNLKGNRKLHK